MAMVKARIVFKCFS